MRRVRTALMAAGAACLPLLALACGDGSDANPTATPVSSKTTPAATATPDAFTPVAVTAEDTAYAARLCTAFNDYSVSIRSALAADPALSEDTNKLLVTIEPIVQALLSDVHGVTPPDAAKPYQVSVEGIIRELLTAVREGRIADIQNFGKTTGVAQPPKAAQDLVRSAAAKAPECAGNSLIFTTQGGG